MFLHHLPFLSAAALALISTVAFGATLANDEGICKLESGKGCLYYYYYYIRISRHDEFYSLKWFTSDSYTYYFAHKKFVVRWV